ncbi:MAG: CRISPR-associated endonuclease Cas2 [Firmicutes bacterium]|nr:CRISPR-associated endonuclease Cas2 [Bacillota bacterium]
MEDYFFDTGSDDSSGYSSKVFVLIIYDISSNKLRTRFAKFLKGYGFRIQKSSFEALISDKKYKQLLGEIPKYIEDEDSIRVYKMYSKAQVVNFGKENEIEDEDIIYI